MNFFKKYSCNKCNKKFSKEEELMFHEQIIHGKDLKYDCKECNKVFLKYGGYENPFTKENIVTRKNR